MRKIKVLVVEDSALFRELLVRYLNLDPVMEVVATASDPYEARDAILQYHPDVMTLDIELPRMNGIEFLRKLMPQYPLPTIVISALSEKVFDALRAGAVDFVSKPVHLNKEQMTDFVRRELVTKIKIASTVHVGQHKNPEAANRTSAVNRMAGGGIGEKENQTTAGRSRTSKVSQESVIAIGASTGGTEAIFDVVSKFGTDIPGTIVVQHMPPGFTAMYAKRLNEHCMISAKEAKTGDKVIRGQVLIAPGDAHMRLVKVNGVYQVECRTGPKVSGHCPSVDVLFESVAKAAGENAIGVILTGMGKDGADGLLAMRKSGAQTIGQNEASCVVYGMPKVAYEIGAVASQVDLQQITRKIYSLLDK